MANLPSEDKVFPLASRRLQTRSRNMACPMSCGSAKGLSDLQMQNSFQQLSTIIRQKSYNPVNFLYFSRSVNTFFATKYKEKNAACQDFSHQIVNTLQKKQEEKGIFLTRASILQYDCQHFGSFG